jgi:hypothetical protein
MEECRHEMCLAIVFDLRSRQKKLVFDICLECNKSE